MVLPQTIAVLEFLLVLISMVIRTSLWETSILFGCVGTPEAARVDLVHDSFKADRYVDCANLGSTDVGDAQRVIELTF